MSSIADFSDMTLHYGDTDYQITAQVGNDVVSVTSDGLNNTALAAYGFSKMMMNAIILTNRASLKEGLHCVENYLGGAAFFVAPLSIFEAKDKLVELKEKGIRALTSYETAKICSAVLEGVFMTGYAILPFGPSLLGSSFETMVIATESLDAGQAGIELAASGIDAFYYGRMYQAINQQLATPDQVGAKQAMLEAVNSQWRQAAFKVAKHSTSILGAFLGHYAFFVRGATPAAMAIAAVRKSVVGLIEGASSVGAHYAAGLSSYQIQEIKVAPAA